VFVEIGKRDIWSAERMAAARPDVRYHAFDLGEVGLADPARLARMLDAIAAAGLAPLPTQSFGLGEATQAFTWMAQARHVGKIVLRHPRAASTVAVRADATYLVTGGLGALGRRVARWLSEAGAGAVVLMGRRGGSVDLPRVHVMAGDVAREADVSAVLARIATELPPLAGVIHAAGATDDAPLAAQTPARLDATMAKAHGALLLDRLTAGLRLDVFLLFSSTSALLGNPGQTGYAAANAVLDALADDRRARGLPAR
jgi:polyketide synthase 12/myxalamid-type polyketide synthase MxaB/epothilone polyketide synthase D